MPRVSLDSIRSCLEGAIPAAVATCSADGIPNATYVSQMQYVDARHVALSFQFFNKTRENILANPQVTALVIDSVTAASYRLELLYLRTETEGGLFQSMKAKLAGIASHSGMSGVFRLQGADIYRVLLVERVPGPELARPAPPRNLLNALRNSSARLSACTELCVLLDQVLVDLLSEFQIPYALLMMADEQARSLYTVGSRGYSASGVGSEIAFGDGVIGVAAEHRCAIRISHMTMEYRYGCAGRAEALAQALPLHAEIPFPGLPAPHSQLAVPILAGGRLLGVLCVESMEDLRFGYDDEDALMTLASQLGLAILRLQQDDEGSSASTASAVAAEGQAGPVLEVRHYAQDHSVFIGGDYLIKGVAGAILWKLLRQYSSSGRSEFSNRELRMASDLGLPEVSDNLEARLILLQRRLLDRCPQLAIEKTGRGLFRLCVAAALKLVEVQT
jgi:hypothetical protein